MSFGVIPLALQFSIAVASWMARSRISAATAAQYAAAEFDYFKMASDAELTSIAFEMARKFPEYPYYEWFRIMEDLREYGAFTPGPAPPPEPPPGADDKDDDEKPSSAWIWAAVGVAVFMMVGEG